MNQIDIITPFTLAINFSSKTLAIVTVKYGIVLITYEDINVELIIASDIEDFKLVLNECKNEESYWKLFVPLLLINQYSRIEAILLKVLGCKMLNKEYLPIISIPFNYYQKLLIENEIELDRFFTLSSCMKGTTFKISKKRYFNFLTINLSKHEILKNRIMLVLRSGIGNENL